MSDKKHESKHLSDENSDDDSESSSSDVSFSEDEEMGLYYEYFKFRKFQKLLQFENFKNHPDYEVYLRIKSDPEEKKKLKKKLVDLEANRIAITGTYD